MKSSGIVRRVDQLGRIVLPMEMRKCMNIVEGTLFEMIVKDDVIMLKKYSILHNLQNVATEILNTLPEGVDVIILDEDKVIATTKSLSNLQGKTYNMDFLKVVEGKMVNAKLGDTFLDNYYVKRVIKDGDLRGVVLLKCDKANVEILLNIINNYIYNKI